MTGRSFRANCRINFGNVSIQVALGLFSAALACAQTVTVEFEGAGAPADGTIAWDTPPLAPPGFPSLGITTYTESGITFTPSNAGITFFGDDTSGPSDFSGNLEDPNSSGDFLFITEVAPTITIDAGGRVFSFDSFRTGTSAGAGDTISITGNLSGGGTFVAPLVAPTNGAGGALTFFALPVGLSGLISAVLTNTGALSAL
ncbi:MAG: hypothetical protein ACI8UO_002765 [Verrucomicrobiales bacterium]